GACPATTQQSRVEAKARRGRRPAPAGPVDVVPEGAHRRCGAQVHRVRQLSGPDPQVGLTRFIGRDDEVDGVAQLLATTPLVTMVGPPGVGKTRLAAEVAGRVAGQFAAGVVSVSLATVTAGEDVAAAIAAALRVRQGPGTGLADALVAATRGEHRLLLLDGCEHVLDHLDPLVR